MKYNEYDKIQNYLKSIATSLEAIVEILSAEPAEDEEVI